MSSNPEISAENGTPGVPLHGTNSPFVLSSAAIPMSIIATTPITLDGGNTYATDLALKFELNSTPQMVQLTTVSGLVPGGQPMPSVGAKQVNVVGNEPISVAGVYFDMNVHLSPDAATLSLSQHEMSIPALKVEWVIGLLDIDVEIGG